METLFIYLLKVSGIAMLFLGCYHLFLKRETFFRSNRWFLLGGLLLSFLAPYITFTKNVVRESLPVYDLQSIAITSATNTSGNYGINLWYVILSIYLLGVAVLGIRLILQCMLLKRLVATGHLIKEYPFYHVQTMENISPFSFFRYIFYNHEGLNASELQSVIEHEKVHAREGHSLDILITEVVLIILWFNPVIWLYRAALKLNLEFLADSKSCLTGEGKKFYQYLMLKQATGNQRLSIANPFYNSLIKKRIVMLNQNQSKRIKVLKMGFILPAVVLFLVSFNTKTEYILNVDAPIMGVGDKDSKSIELLINKDTSNEELEKIKQDLSKDGIDFSYTVVHNAEDEIIDISLHLSGKSTDGENFVGNYSTSSDGPIKPISIYYNDEANTITFGNSDFTKIKSHAEHDKVWVRSGDKKHKTIVIEEKDGTKKITLDGKEVSEEEMEEMHIEHHDGAVEVHINSDNDTDQHEHIEIRKHKSHDATVHEDINIVEELDVHNDSDALPGSNRLLFRDSDSKEKPLYFVDGKKAKEKDVQKLSPHDIESMNVYKGDGAIKKYGKKAKNGVIEIATKKKN
ncbi:M56 family metallopeptidase [Flagellimonas sp. 2504JD4-2]